MGGQGDDLYSVDNELDSVQELAAAGWFFDGVTGATSANGQTASVTLAAGEGKKVTLLREELESLVGTNKSLMPEGLAEQPVVQAFRQWLQAEIGADYGL